MLCTVRIRKRGGLMYMRVSLRYRSAGRLACMREPYNDTGYRCTIQSKSRERRVKDGEMDTEGATKTVGMQQGTTDASNVEKCSLHDATTFIRLRIMLLVSRAVWHLAREPGRWSFLDTHE